LVGPTGLTQKVFFVKFSLPLNFFVPLEKLTDPDPEKLYGSFRIRIRNTAFWLRIEENVTEAEFYKVKMTGHVLVYKKSILT
jgi:hypothetical protein